MAHHHREALRMLGVNLVGQRVFLTGGGAETVRQLLPEYAAAKVEMLEEGSLRGVAQLFQAESNYNSLPKVPMD
jgi:hypothetical protein